MDQHEHLIIGAGVGKAIAYWLLKQPDTAGVRIADTSLERAQSAVEQVIPDWDLCQTDHDKFGPMYLPVDKLTDEQLIAAFSPYSVVISAIPAKFNPRLAQLAIKAGVHFCDLGGVVDVTRKMLLLNDGAVKAGVAVVPDCGLMPGLGVILAQRCLERLDLNSSVGITIWVGGLPQKPQGPLNYQRTFSLEGLKHLVYDPIPVLQDGKIVMTEPFDFRTELRVKEFFPFSPDYGTAEAFESAGASLAPWTFQEQGVKYFNELTLRWPGFMDFVKDIPADEFEQRIGPLLPSTDALHPDLVYMWVQAQEATGLKRKNGCRLLDFYDHTTGLSAMERTTGFSTAVLAQMLARGEILPGVHTPEKSFPSRTKMGSYIDLVSRSLDIVPGYDAFRTI